MQKHLSQPTPVAKVRRDDEEVGWVCQILAEQFSILLFLTLTQGSHEHGDDAKLVFVAAQDRNQSIDSSANIQLEEQVLKILCCSGLLETLH